MKNITSILLMLLCLALSPKAQAVTPAPDGGYAGFNTAEGQNALFSLSSGVWNTALGGYSLFSDTSGSSNTAVGLKALRQNTTGASNTAVGLDALFSNRRELGDLHTLADRISAEVAEANTVVSLIALVGAWSRKPATADSARSEAVARQRE